MIGSYRLFEFHELCWECVHLEAGEHRLCDSKTGGRAAPLAPSAGPS